MSALTAEQSADLRARLVRALDVLDEMADRELRGRRLMRLMGKAEGVRLALSYLDEYQRGLLR